MKNNLKKMTRLFVLMLLIISVIKVNADTNDFQQIGATQATIKGSNYEINNENKEIILDSEAKVELTGDANDYKIVVKENAKDVSIILNNYSSTVIDDGYNNSNKIELKSGSSATLTLIGINNLKAGFESSAIRVPINTSLIIDGNGTLNAEVYNGTSNASSAVIGSQYNYPFGDIIINGGNINTSFSGSGIGTGIGAGVWEDDVEMAGTITLNGGSIHTEVLGSITGSDKVSLKGNGSATLYTDNLYIDDEEFNGIIFDSDGKNGSVKGNITLSKDLEIPPDGVLLVEEGASLNIPPNVTVTNNGKIKNDGTITNKGNLQNDGTIENSGVINSATNVDKVEGNTVQPILYDINIKVSNGGTIDYNSTLTIKYGENKTFKISPNKGYRIKCIMVNGVDKTDYVVDGKLTLLNITEDINIEVEFEKDAENPETYDNILRYIGLGILSILAIIVSICFKKYISSKTR